MSARAVKACPPTREVQMKSRKRKSSHCAILTAALVCLSAFAVAQTPNKATKDEKEIAAFKLTTEGFTKYSKAVAAMSELEKKDPSFKEKHESSDSQTIDETVQQFERTPQAMSALKSAGLTPRQFVLTTYALVVNAIVLAFKQQPGMMKELPAGASKENIEFMEKHRKEIEALHTKDPD